MNTLPPWWPIGRSSARAVTAARPGPEEPGIVRKVPFGCRSTASMRPRSDSCYDCHPGLHHQMQRSTAHSAADGQLHRLPRQPEPGHGSFLTPGSAGRPGPQLNRIMRKTCHPRHPQSTGNNPYRNPGARRSQLPACPSEPPRIQDPVKPWLPITIRRSSNQEQRLSQSGLAACAPNSKG